MSSIPSVLGKRNQLPPPETSSPKKFKKITRAAMEIAAKAIASAQTRIFELESTPYGAGDIAHLQLLITLLEMKRGDFEAAERTMQKIEDHECRAEALIAMSSIKDTQTIAKEVIGNMNGGDKYSQSKLFLKVARIEYEQDQQVALETFQKAVNSASKEENPRCCAKGFLNLAKFAFEKGHSTKGQELLVQAKKSAYKIRELDRRALVLLKMAEVEFQESLEEANTTLDAAEKEAFDEDDPWYSANALLKIANFKSRQKIPMNETLELADETTKYIEDQRAQNNIIKRISVARLESLENLSELEKEPEALGRERENLIRNVGVVENRKFIKNFMCLVDSEIEIEKK